MYQYTAAPVLEKNIFLDHLHLLIYFPSNSIVQLLMYLKSANTNV